MAASRAVSVAILHAPEDRPFAQQLATHLRVMERQGLIDVWQLDEIRPGENFDAALRHNAQAADMLLPLLSSDFLASDTFWSIMIGAKERARWVFPIVVRACDWSNMPMSYDRIPRLKDPVVSFARRDDAWQLVVSTIRKIVAPSEGIREVVRHSLRLEKPDLPSTPSVSLPEELRHARIESIHSKSAIDAVRQVARALSVCIIGSKGSGAEPFAAAIFNASERASWIEQDVSTALLHWKDGDKYHVTDPWRSPAGNLPGWGARDFYNFIDSNVLRVKTLIINNFGLRDSFANETRISHEKLLRSRRAAGLQTVVVTALPKQGVELFYGPELAQLIFADSVIDLRG